MMGKNTSDVSKLRLLSINATIPTVPVKVNRPFMVCPALPGRPKGISSLAMAHNAMML